MCSLSIPPGSCELEHRNRSHPDSLPDMQRSSRELAERFYMFDFHRFGYSTSVLPARRLVQYWDNAHPPPSVQGLMNVVRDLHPDWDYQCFSRQLAADELGSIYGKDLKEAFLDIRFPAMQADVFRIAYLLRHGGLLDAATLIASP